MELCEIVAKAIPFKDTDCRLIRREKENQRKVLTERIIEYAREEKAKK